MSAQLCLQLHYWQAKFCLFSKVNHVSELPGLSFWSLWYVIYHAVHSTSMHRHMLCCSIVQHLVCRLFAASMT